jgi:hypothetical protein
MNIRKTVLLMVGCFSLLCVTAVNGEKVPRPEDAEFYRLYVGPNDELVVAMTNGVYRSTDVGKHWVRVLKIDSSLVAGHGRYVSAICDWSRYLSNDSGATWSAGGFLDRADSESVRSGRPLVDGSYYRCKKGGVQVSDDAGMTWRFIPTGHDCNAVTTNGNVMYIVAGNALFRSNDRGENWSLVRQTTQSPLDSSVDSFAFAVDYNGILYANKGGLYQSRDGGESWHRQTFGLPENVFPRIYGVRRDAIYFVDRGAQGNANAKFYRSEDGKEATRMTLDYPWYSDIQVGKDGAIYVVTRERIYRSSDHGATWTPLGREGIVQMSLP